jgi:hypothetical protein
MPAFCFVPFGGCAPARAVACDGLVAGAAIDLSHWPRNQTPIDLKRDTSVEIALAFGERRASIDAALDVVCNNHFDADGVLACWAALRPELAREHAALLVGAAEAGDFDAWPSSDERGLRLEAAIARLASGRADPDAYRHLLPLLDRLVPEIDRREDLWGAELAALQARGADLDRGRVAVERVGRIALIAHSAGVEELPGAWISRVSEGADRLLLAFEAEPGRFRYRYELPRWCWADTVARPKIAMPRRGPIRRRLGEAWVIKGRRGMTGVAYTDRAIASPPRAAADALAEIDRS